MIQHIWGLLYHPTAEWQLMQREDQDNIRQMAEHHVLLLALIPVICSYIGTTQFGWNFGDGSIRLSAGSALGLGILFYFLIICAVAFMGYVIHRMSDSLPHQPELRRCITFAGYIATPMFLCSVVSLYPMLWLCCLAAIVGLLHTSYLLYVGVPNFLSLNKEEAFSLSSSILAIGVLVLEALALALVLFWRYGIALIS